MDRHSTGLRTYLSGSMLRSSSCATSCQLDRPYSDKAEDGCKGAQGALHRRTSGRTRFLPQAAARSLHEDTRSPLVQGPGGLQARSDFIHTKTHLDVIFASHSCIGERSVYLSHSLFGPHALKSFVPPAGTMLLKLNTSPTFPACMPCTSPATGRLPK